MSTVKRPSVKKTAKNLKRKVLLARVVTVVVTLFALLLLLLGVLALVRGCVRKNAPKPKGAPIVSAPDLAPSDAYEDIFGDADYMKTDRAIHYRVDDGVRVVSYVLDEHDKQTLTEGGRFFLRYFDAVVNGDYETYHTFFSDVYRENEDGFKDFEKQPDTREFPMQRVYDITVTELGRTQTGDENYTYRGEKVVYSVYEVSYKILKNGGDFRVDLREGGTVPLIFELMTFDAGTEDERTVINGLYRYADLPAED